MPRGINDHNDAVGRSMLADVNPTFNWVRLAQRVPVRVQIESVPDGVRLVAGQTCTVIVEAGQRRTSTPPSHGKDG